jgi:pantoate--beta-alanine ligase
MKILNTVVDLRKTVAQWRAAGERVALAPTMGNLHAGHLQLVEQAHSHADRVVVSIFVNPMQFGDASGNGGDFSQYPRTFTEDCEKLAALEKGVDAVFVPAVDEVYPNGHEHETRVEVPEISDILCGEFRPGHFVGVATVVAKLFNMVQPDVALFGEKDFQQLLVIRRFTKELCFPIEIIGVPTVREASGLAMSSRNQYLFDGERETASILFQVLSSTKKKIEQGLRDFPGMEKEAMKRLEEAGFRPEYFSVRNAVDLMPAKPDDQQVVILVAAWLGSARLIDNIKIIPKDQN